MTYNHAANSQEYIDRSRRLARQREIEREATDNWFTSDLRMGDVNIHLEKLHYTGAPYFRVVAADYTSFNVSPDGVHMMADNVTRANPFQLSLALTIAQKLHARCKAYAEQFNDFMVVGS